MTRFTVSSHPALIRLATNWQPMVTKMPTTGYHSVAQEKMKRGIAVVFVSVPDLLMDIRDSFGTGGTAGIRGTMYRADGYSAVSAGCAMLSRSREGIFG